MKAKTFLSVQCFSLFLILPGLRAEEKVLTEVMQTTYGPIQGFQHALIDGTLANIFLGIPFAEPPVRKQRLEKPKPPVKWKQTLQTTEFKPGCIPVGSMFANSKTSEDCLYLNIFAPQVPADANGYPVLVWIHGGGYQDGSAEFHGFEVLADKFLTRGVIVVTIQYRLGPLGFMAWGDETFPGNYGLWDARAALKFVSTNIGRFGGNSHQITVWGESAGADIVSSLSLSKHSRDLFSQAIQNSGSSFSERASSNRVIQASEELGKELKCDIQESYKFKDCVRQKTVEEIHEAFKKTGISRYEVSARKYQPRLDADFFTDDLPNLVEQAPKKPTMIGLALEEALMFVAMPKHPLGMSKNDAAEYSEANFTKFVQDIVAPKSVFGNKFREVQDKIIKFYLHSRDAPTHKDSRFFLSKYTQLLSDVMFNVPAINELRFKVAAGWKVFSYLSVYGNKRVFPKEWPLKKPMHAYEYPYIFDIDHPGFRHFEFNDNDREFAQILLDTIAAFVKTGNPSTEDIEWLPATADNNLRYLELKPYSPEMKAPLFGDRLQFWALLTKHYEFDLIRGIHKKTLRSRDEL